MKGRYTIFSLILIANIMLLVHSVIPHHHHKGIVCFTETNTHKSSDCNSGNNCTHHGSESDDTGCCVVKQDYLVPSDEIGKTTRCVVNEHNSKIQSWFVALLTSSIEFKVFTTNNFKHQFFDVLLHYSYYLTSSLSLRAPPSI